MGSLFSPSVPRYSPVSYTPAIASSVNETSGEGETSPNTSQDNEEEIVRDIIRRNFRGRNSTIQTSYRGVLGEDNALAPKRKTLLGE